MTFRDDRDALLARADALEYDLAQAKEQRADAEGQRDRLQRERDAMAKELEELRGPSDDGSIEGIEDIDDDEWFGDGNPAEVTEQRWIPLMVGGTVLALIVGAGFMGYYLTKRNRNERPTVSASAGRPVSMCPLRGDGTLILFDEIVSENRRKSFYFYNVYDGATGKRRLRVALPGKERRRPTCFGYEGDMVWLRRGDKTGLFALRLSTGELVRRQADIATEAGVLVHEARFDNNGHHVLISTMDGRRYHVIATDGFRLVAVPESHRSTLAPGVPWPQNKSTWARLDGQRRVRPEGNQRRRFMIGTQPVGDRDWLLPKLVYNPGTHTPLWPTPESLLIVEPTLIRSEIFQLTRYSLAGRVLWEFNPQTASHTTNWANYIAIDDTLVYPTKDGRLIGLDPTTGQERYRVKL